MADLIDKNAGPQKSKAEDLMRRHAAMQGDRYNFESIWQRVADLIFTGEALFQRQYATQGERRDRFQFDSTGALALERFTAAIESVITPRTEKWAGIQPVEKALRDDMMVRRYCEELNDILFSYRYRAKAGFTTANGEHYRSLGAFGTGCTFVEDNIQTGGMRYRAWFLGEVFIATNFQGMVDTVHRCFEWDARQAFQRFGDGPNGEYRKAAEKGGQAKFQFLHCIAPAEDYDPDSYLKRRPIASHYVDMNHHEIVEQGGYFSMPAIVSRMTTSPRETYGRGPAITVLNSLNTVNEMQKTLLRAGQKSADPPLLVAESDALRGFNLKSGALNYGGLNENGQQMVMPMETGKNMPLAADMTEAERQVVNEAFYVTLFQILVENRTMTATEALLRAQEKGALLAPPMGRQQTEYLGPMIEREIDILMRQGRIPPPPPQLMEAGGELEVEYTAPLNRLQDSEKGVAIVRTFEAIAPIAQVDPSVLDGINLAKSAQTIAKVNGMPADCLLSDDELEAKKAERAEAQQAQMLLEAAPVAGKVAADLAKAQAAGLQAPDVSTLLQP